jgi:hypothetical protein
MGEIGTERKRVRVVPLPEPAQAPVAEPSAPEREPEKVPA